MKIKSKNKFIYVLILLLLLVACFPLASSVAYADTQVMSSDMDENLFYKLARVKGSGISYTYLTTESFNNEKFETIDLSGNGTVNTDSNIEDLTGLTMLKFNYTKTLIVSNNSVKIITAEILSAFPKLEKLVVSNNLLESIDISGCYNLKTVILDNNQLTEFDATDMVATDAEIDLSSNLIDSIYDITLPNQLIDISTTIKLYNNNISDYVPLGEGYTAYLGLQGLQANIDNVVQQNQPIVYYKANDGQQVKTVITSDGVEKYSFIDSEMVEDKTVIDIPNGNYEISYYFIKPDGSFTESSTKRHPSPVGETFYNYNPADQTKDVNSYLRYYNYREFSVLPTKPTFIFVIDGETYQFGEINKIKKESVIQVTSDADTTIYYQIGEAGDWVQGSEIPVERGGKYSISIKAVSADGFTSEITTVYINATANLNFPDILIIFLITIGMVILFGVGYPLLRKYVL